MIAGRRRSFEEARAFARGTGLRDQAEWTRWARTPDRPRDIPAHPDRVYGQWAGWEDWLGEAAGTPATVGEAEEEEAVPEGDPAVRRLRPLPLYLDPGGVTWRYWFVIQYLTARGTYRRRRWRHFHEARAFVRAQGFRNKEDWSAWGRAGLRPHDIPARPDVLYRGHGWISLGDFLGTDRSQGI